MRILVAPDKFKGSLGAAAVAENIAAGLREVLPRARIELAPMADGGEGSAEIISEALDGNRVRCFARDPFGRAVECHYAYIERDKLAVMEMSEAVGLRRLRRHEREPLRATTFGVGEMILDAIHRGVDQIIIGLGGSATNDGGFGMARALGFRFFAHDGTQLRAAVSKLTELKSILKPAKLLLPKIVAAADVANPLLGKNGATRVFGPQKGATPEQINLLESCLTRLATVAALQFGFNHEKTAGSGAAGGLGFGLMTFASAVIRPGFDVVAEITGLETKISCADVVITGEGSLDAQTLNGKTPAGVARLARKLGKRVFAIVGQASDERKVRELFDGVYALGRRELTVEQSINRAAQLLRARASELAARLKSPANMI